MTFPWFPLFLNILLLAAAIFICNAMNAARPAPVWNGPLLFIGFCILAMVLDLALMMVFATATTTDRDRYIDLSSIVAWCERAIAYAIPCAQRFSLYAHGRASTSRDRSSSTRPTTRSRNCRPDERVCYVNVARRPVRTLARLGGLTGISATTRPSPCNGGISAFCVSYE
jgi:hypothetical protein